MSRIISSIILLLFVSSSLSDDVPNADLDFDVTCNRDSMIIVKPVVNTEDKMYVDDTDVSADGLTQYTTCTISLEAGPPEKYTMTVDLTEKRPSNFDTNPVYLGKCPPNTWPADATDDPQVYSKNVLWSTAAKINWVPDSGDATTITIVRYKIQCSFKLTNEQDADQGEVTVTILETTVEPFEVAAPTVNMAVLTDDGDITFDPATAPPTSETAYALTDIMKLVVYFDSGATSYWEHMRVMDCWASNDAGFEVNADRTFKLITDGCPVGLNGQKVIQSIEYNDNSNADNKYNKVIIKFKAFRIAQIQNVWFKCRVRTCANRAAANCAAPTSVTWNTPLDVSTNLAACTPPSTPFRRRRMFRSQSRAGTEALVTQVKTGRVTVEDGEDTVITKDDYLTGKYTCMTTMKFSSLVGVLSVLLFISLIVAAYQCARGRHHSKQVELESGNINQGLRL